MRARWLTPRKTWHLPPQKSRFLYPCARERAREAANLAKKIA
jgi:hypothetical protein